MKRSLFLICAIIVAILNAVSQDKPGKSGSDNYAPVSLPNTELRPFHSTILNQDMLIYVKLPVSYYKSSQKTYPALYTTDANLGFAMSANILGLFEVIPPPPEPEICLIGIGYKIGDMNDYLAWRTRDLTPPMPGQEKAVSEWIKKGLGKNYDVKPGGAEKFLKFVAEEVIPFVEFNYRVSPKGRGIGGYSAGGFFALYAMFNRPDLFSLYYAGSPAISDSLFIDEKAYASSHKDLNARLFMSFGGAEPPQEISEMNKMAELLRSRNYPGLKIDTLVFPDETHRSACPASVMRAYTVLYNKK
jgi:predicted alpha/beta superfamily hydrolase